MEHCRPCSVRIPRIHGLDADWDADGDADEHDERGGRAARGRAHRQKPHPQHRLGAKENGMVMLPRSFYNSHPAHLVAGNRGRRPEPKAGKHGARPHKGRKRPRSPVKEYRLMFVEPEEVAVAEADVEPSESLGGGLAKLVTDRNLPSSRWKIEKVYFEKPEREASAGAQPYDALDAELEALMGGDGAPRPKKAEDEPKQPEEFPSIMDILNEPAAEAVPEEAAVAPDGQNGRSDENLKSVLFRRLGEDEATVDRTVTFQYNLEYTVTIGEKKVELLGAPGLITSDEDLKILLQIVDDLDPDCGCLDFCDS